MAILTFPTDFPQPVSPEAESSSYKEDFKESTIKTETDANYVVSRPRATRMPGMWTYSWRGVTAEEYAELITFWKNVGGTANYFYFTPWFSAIQTTQTMARFTLKGDWQLYAEGYRGTLSFEEV